MSKRAAIYLRVSTTEQTTENQRRELLAAARRHGWLVVEVFEDAGVSGAKSPKQRTGLNAMMKGVARREYDIVAAWSVDRLGRSLQDLVILLGELHSKGVDLFLHQQGLDTSTPAGMALFGMLGVFAEFERAIIRERIKSGLERAKSQGRKIGRPHISSDVASAILTARKRGIGVNKIASELHVGVSTVMRILRGG
jgi:DNA invertase Pin-like site-specific DNA recombinase